MIISFRTKKQDQENREVLEKVSQADRIRRLEDQMKFLASVSHDISEDLDELRIIIRQLLQALKDSKQ